MKPTFLQRNWPTMLIATILFCIVAPAALTECSTGPKTPVAHIVAAHTSTALPTVILPVRHRTDEYEAGMVFPRWNQDGYSDTDATFHLGLATIKIQTTTRWLEMPILMAQDTDSSTSVHVVSPSLLSFEQGIRAARLAGYSVFVVPLINPSTSGSWAGTIHPVSTQDESKWFTSYWQAYEPYVTGAEAAQVEQLSIGTELDWLQEHAPAFFWEQLLQRAGMMFHGWVTYDMNHSEMNSPIPSWETDTRLSALGVPVYKPLINSPSVVVHSGDMVGLWRVKIQTEIDSLAQRSGKPIILSEIGYRDTSDALYQSWRATSTLPVDQQTQANAIGAALTCISQDSNIHGSFFWGWQDTGRFDLAGSSAVNVIHHWYTIIGERVFRRK